MRQTLNREITTILGISSLIGLNSCSDPALDGTSLVINADPTHVIYDGSTTISGYYHREQIPQDLKNGATYNAYLSRTLELNPSLNNFGSIPAGKVLILPNLDGIDNESQAFE